MGPSLWAVKRLNAVTIFSWQSLGRHSQITKKLKWRPGLSSRENCKRFPFLPSLYLYARILWIIVRAYRRWKKKSFVTAGKTWLMVLLFIVCQVFNQRLRTASVSQFFYWAHIYCEKADAVPSPCLFSLIFFLIDYYLLINKKKIIREKKCCAGCGPKDCALRIASRHITGQHYKDLLKA